MSKNNNFYYFVLLLYCTIKNKKVKYMLQMKINQTTATKLKQCLNFMYLNKYYYFLINGPKIDLDCFLFVY